MDIRKKILYWKQVVEQNYMIMFDMIDQKFDKVLDNQRNFIFLNQTQRTKRSNNEKK